MSGTISISASICNFLFYAIGHYIAILLSFAASLLQEVVARSMVAGWIVTECDDWVNSMELIAENLCFLIVADLNQGTFFYIEQV